jgi:hypothetical protein
MSWLFLLEILSHLSFPHRWVDWNSVLLSTASTRVMLNGTLGLKICHSRGLRLGDPLSPMLFLLVMEVLSEMFQKADEWSLLHELRDKTMPFQCVILCRRCHPFHLSAGPRFATHETDF